MNKTIEEIEKLAEEKSLKIFSPIVGKVEPINFLIESLIKLTKQSFIEGYTQCQKDNYNQTKQ